MAKAAVGLRVQGLREVQKAFRDLGGEVEDQRDVMHEIAVMGAGVMRSVAPRASGRLAGDIRPNRAKAKAVVMVGRASIPYAAAQQWGWGAAAAGHKNGRARGAMRGSFAGHRYFEKTDAVLETRALRMLEDGLNKRIRAKQFK